MQTKEQRNKRASQRRFERHQHLYESIKFGYEALWSRAANQHWTFQQVLNYKRDFIPKVNGDLNNLPIWAQERLYGVWDALMDLHWHRLTFCYAHPDTAAVTPSNVLCDDGLASRIDTDTGCHYYKNDDGTFSDRFN